MATISRSPWSPTVRFTATQLSFLGMEQAKLTASPQTVGDMFGVCTSLSLDGNLAAVGAPEDSLKATKAGCVYLYRRNGTNWIQAAKLFASDPVANHLFGVSVSLSENGLLLFVGATGDTAVGGRGAVYVFSKAGDSWVQIAKLKPTGASTEGLFGVSLSSSSNGETLAVGSHLETGSGCAYVFFRGESVWTQQARILASDAASGMSFGFCVSLSSNGTDLVVGAPGADASRGAAYLFGRVLGAWAQRSKIQAADGVADDQFGYSVSLSSTGSTLLAGAPNDDDSASNTGSAYVFDRTEAVWSQKAKLTASDPTLGSFFGVSVSLSKTGLTAAIGALGKSLNTGAAYCFSVVNNSWVQRNKVLPADAVASIDFGVSVAVNADGTVLSAGARRGDQSRGASYIFV